MLGKLLKYDLKWVYKVVIVFYFLALIFSVLGRGISEIENSLIFSVIAKILLTIAISMIISSLINCLMRLWARFIKNMYKDESYLTHTLPVEKKTIYVSKILSALITVLTTTIVAILCIAICFYSPENIEILKTMLELAASTYNTTVINLLLLIAVVLLLEIIYIVFIGYVGIILGYKSNKNKMVKTLIIAFSLYFIMQTLTLGLVAIYGLFDESVMNLINTVETINIETIKSVMYVGIVIYIVYILFLYFLGKKELQKGVDVD